MASNNSSSSSSVTTDEIFPPLTDTATTYASAPSTSSSSSSSSGAAIFPDKQGELAGGASRSPAVAENDPRCSPQKTTSPRATSASTALSPRLRPDTYSFVVSGTTFQIDLKYKLLKPIGHGAYGVVMYGEELLAMYTKCGAVSWLTTSARCVYFPIDRCSSAENTDSKEKVAIKKISKAFEDIVDGKRILREIKLLQHFDHENVISIVDLLPPASVTEFEDVYIISDLMETDLHRIIYSRQPLTDDHIQYFLYQVDDAPDLRVR